MFEIFPLCLLSAYFVGQFCRERMASYLVTIKLCIDNNPTENAYVHNKPTNYHARLETRTIVLISKCDLTMCLMLLLQNNAT